MRISLSVLARFVLFLVTFAVGSFLVHPFHVQTVLSVTPGGTRLFVWDGVLLTLAMYVVVLAVDASRKRLRWAAGWTTLALVLAGAAGLAMKFGFLSTER